MKRTNTLTILDALAFGFILLIFFVPFVFSIIFDLAELQSSILISRSI